MSWLLAGLLIGVLGAGWFGFERQREVYEQLVRTLENDRDAARNESKVFRGLLFPVLNRIDNRTGSDIQKGVNQITPASGDGTRQKSGQLPTQVHPEGSPRRDEASPAQRRVRSRLPFRTQFNIARKLMNLPQQKTDTLAAALEKQKPLNPVQEKTHVAS